MDRRPSVRRALPLAACILLGLAAGQLSGAVLAADRADEGAYTALDIFARVLTEIEDSYVEPVGQRELVYRALGGLDDALDAHSTFLTPDAFRRIREESDGQFIGIGAQMRAAPCGLSVAGVVREGPAARAGILPGDCIVTVDNTPLANLSLDSALSLVRGREGEAVTLGVERAHVTHPVAVLRTRMLEASVDVELLAPGWVYARVRQFREGAAEDLRARVSALAVEGSIQGAVLDLRQNPGGRLSEAVAMVDLFLRDGRIVQTKGRGAQPDEVYDATSARTDWDWPLVVLIDGQSASAAEIVAGALQDRRRASLIGERSYGKGSVQSVFEYEDGSALKLTIARYILPSGRLISDHEGLVPDLPVAAPSVPGAAYRLRERIAAAPGLAAADRREMLELMERMPQDSHPTPLDFGAPLQERLARDPALAAGWAALQARR